MSQYAFGSPYRRRVEIDNVGAALVTAPIPLVTPPGIILRVWATASDNDDYEGWATTGTTGATDIHVIIRETTGRVLFDYRFEPLDPELTVDSMEWVDHFTDCEIAVQLNPAADNTGRVAVEIDFGAAEG